MDLFPGPPKQIACPKCNHQLQVHVRHWGSQILSWPPLTNWSQNATEATWLNENVHIVAENYEIYPSSLVFITFNIVTQNVYSHAATAAMNNIKSYYHKQGLPQKSWFKSLNHQTTTTKLPLNYYTIMHARLRTWFVKGSFCNVWITYCMPA